MSAPRFIRMLRKFALHVTAGGVLAFAAASAASAAPACNGVIYSNDAAGSNKLYQFTPPSATATLVATVNPALGTISRGPATGNIYSVAFTNANSGLYRYPVTGGAGTQVGTFANTTFIYASGFKSNGTGYALSSTEAMTFTDANPSVIGVLPGPQTSSGPALSTFNSGDLAFDVNDQGWTVLTSTANNNSYLYKVGFGAQTLLTEVAQITLGGSAYTTADLYDFGFGSGNIAYVSGGTTGKLYSINLSTGALTLIGAQGFNLGDFASCPFFPNPAITKTGPAQAAPGDLIQYTILATNAAGSSAPAASVQLVDPVPAGMTIVSAACSGTSGVNCAVPTVAGQNVSTTVPSIPAGGSATMVIYAKDATLALGPTTNTATFKAANAATATAGSTVTVVANTVSKTVANITQGTPATGSSDLGVPGDTLEYVLSYVNNANTNLTTYTLSDIIPANTTYVPGSSSCVTVPSGLTCTPSGPTSGSLSWAFTGGALAPGATVSVKFHVRIK